MCAQKKMQTKQGDSSSVLTQLTQDNLGFEIQKKEVDSTAFSTWIRALRQNWRQGTVGVKDRSEVSFSNKKPWKQKGTGRARAGSARSPLWRGGGVIFGPQPRTRVLRVSKALRKGVLNSLFWNYLEAGNIHVLSWELNAAKPSTQTAYSLLKKHNLLEKKVTLFLPIQDILTYASFANIPNVQVVFFDEANAFTLVNAHHWIVLEKDRDSFKEMVSKWD